MIGKVAGATTTPRQALGLAGSVVVSAEPRYWVAVEVAVRAAAPQQRAAAAAAPRPQVHEQRVLLVPINTRR